MNCCAVRRICARNKTPIGNSCSKRSRRSLIRDCARSATPSSKIGASDFGEQQQRDEIITRGAEGSLNTLRK